MDKALRRDVIEWDEVNWSRAVDYWLADMPTDLKGLKALEIGARGGGVALLLALRGAEVLYTDLTLEHADEARALHERYGVGSLVDYAAVDVTQMDYTEQFDIVVFKSVCGGVGSCGNDARQQVMIDNIYRALKPGGKLYFAENLVSTRLHMWARRTFHKWGGRWNYLTVEDVERLTGQFAAVRYRTYGFLGAFGRNRFFSNLLGHIDSALDRFVKPESRYIVSAVCEK